MKSNRIDEALYGKKYSLIDIEVISARQNSCNCATQKATARNREDFGIDDNNQQLRQADPNETMLACVTISCCSGGIFTVELFEIELCHYVSSSRVALTFFPTTRDSTLEVTDNMLLAGLVGRKGEGLVLPKGKYKVENGNQINFQPVVAREEKKYCYIIRGEGSILGHEFNYEIKYCVSVSSTSAVAAVILEPQISDYEFAELLKQRNREITFTRDMVIREGNQSFIVKSGAYKVSKDGKVYLQLPLSCR